MPARTPGEAILVLRGIGHGEAVLVSRGIRHGETAFVSRGIGIEAGD